MTTTAIATADDDDRDWIATRDWVVLRDLRTEALRRLAMATAPAAPRTGGPR